MPQIVLFLPLYIYIVIYYILIFSTVDHRSSVWQNDYSIVFWSTPCRRGGLELYSTHTHSTHTYTLCGVSPPTHRSLGLRVKPRPEPEVALVQLVQAWLLKRLGVHNLPQLSGHVRRRAVDPPLRRQDTSVSYTCVLPRSAIRTTCMKNPLFSLKKRFKLVRIKVDLYHARRDSHQEAMTRSDATNHYSSGLHRFRRKYNSAETLWTSVVVIDVVGSPSTLLETPCPFTWLSNQPIRWHEVMQTQVFIINIKIRGIWCICIFWHCTAATWLAN